MVRLADVIKQASVQQNADNRAADERIAHLIDALVKTEQQRVADNRAASESMARLIESLSLTQASSTQSLAHIKETIASHTEALERATRRAEIRNGARRLSIVFFMQSTAVWPSWKTFWEACASDPRIEATMVLTPACYPDRELGWLDEVRDFLIKEGIGFITAEAYQIERFKPDIAILQLPYSDTLPQHLQLSKLEAANVRKVYIPYGLETGGGGLNYRYQFDLPVQRTAWRVFVRSARLKRMYAKYCRSGSGHVVVAGHPKLDLQFHDQDAYVADEALVKQIAGRKTIFWNPHFSVQDPPAWSTFDLFKDGMLDAIEARPELFFIVRPHPLLFGGLLKSGFWSASDEAAFRARIEGIENCILDELPDYQMAFTLSDMMLTDAGSFLMEYFATGKPLLLLQNPAGFGLNDDASALEGIYKATTIEEVEAFLDMIRMGQDPKEAERKKAIPLFFDGLDGRAGERIRDHIYGAFINDEGGLPVDVEPSSQALQTSHHQLMDEKEREDIGQKLAQILALFDPVLAALHIGCADGRLTQVISHHARFTHGIDADPALIAQAQQNSAGWSGEGKVSFSVEGFDRLVSCGVYDLIVCIDVLSSITSNPSIIRYVDILIAMMREGAYLVVGDMLVGGQACIQTEDGRSILCRNTQQYLAMFRRHGLALVETVAGSQTDGCGRHYYVFRKIS